MRGCAKQSYPRVSGGALSLYRRGSGGAYTGIWGRSLYIPVVAYKPPVVGERFLWISASRREKRRTSCLERQVLNEYPK
jgi:hypothetical protein